MQCPNSKYRMIYLNMGHGDDCFSDAAQKQLFTNAFRWVVSKSPKGNPFEKRGGRGGNHPLIPLAFHTVSFAAFISWNFFSAALRTSSPSDATRSGWFFKASRR